VKAFVTNPEAVAALVMTGTAAGASNIVSNKLPLAGSPVAGFAGVAVSVMGKASAAVRSSTVPEISPVDELTLKPEGKVEVLYTGDVTPEDVIVYDEKGYPACAVAVVPLVMEAPITTSGAEAAA
jgi:uncharacterized protein YhfF